MAQKKKTNALIIFIKNPVKGKVKTRLAKDASEDYALKVYLELQRHTRDEVADVKATRYLYYSSHIPENDIWDPTLFIKKVQENGDLGDKINASFIDVLKDHGKVIIVGSDCIQLTSEIIESAFALLDNYDVVIGPAVDGGYYLLGMKEHHPEIFTSIHWSTEVVLDQTMERVLSLGLSCHLLKELSDIDYLEDRKSVV